MYRKLKFGCQAILSCATTLLLITSLAAAAEKSEEENASNPLAKVKNTDLRYQYFDMDDSRVNDFFIDGALIVVCK